MSKVMKISGAAGLTSAKTSFKAADKNFPDEGKNTEKSGIDKTFVYSAAAAIGLAAIAGWMLLRGKGEKAQETAQAAGGKLQETADAVQAGIKKYTFKTGEAADAGMDKASGIVKLSDGSVFSGTMETIDKEGQKITAEYADGYITSIKFNDRNVPERTFSDFNGLSRSEAVSITTYRHGKPFKINSHIKDSSSGTYIIKEQFTDGNLTADRVIITDNADVYDKSGQKQMSLSSSNFINDNQEFSIYIGDGHASEIVIANQKGIRGTLDGSQFPSFEITENGIKFINPKKAEEASKAQLEKLSEIIEEASKHGRKAEMDYMLPQEKLDALKDYIKKMPETPVQTPAAGQAV